MHISREEFLARQAERADREQQGPYVGFLKIPDGGEAVVRFIYESPEELDIIAYHLVPEPGKPEYQGKRYNCKRETFSSPITDCKFCSDNIPLKQRVFLKMVEYVRDEKDNIIAVPRIWERSTSWATKLYQLFEEYPDLNNYVFKIKRTGSGLDSKYSDPMLANPTIYNSEVYPKDFSGFDSYSVVGAIIQDSDAESPSSAEVKSSVTEAATQSRSNTTSTPPRRVTY